MVVIKIFLIITNTLAKDKSINDNWRNFSNPVSSRNLTNVVEDKVVDALILDESDYGNEDVPDNTIKTRIRRKLQNGLSGKETDPKGGMTSMGIEYEDGYNYWIEVNAKEAGATKFFIKRGKDFKRS